jgi:hypothetical protein
MVFHPWYHQSSGLVERLNRTIEDMISKFVSKNQKDWDRYLPYLMMAYRSSVHDTMGWGMYMKCHKVFSDVLLNSSVYP